jgi:hypothetical protein
VFYNVLQKIAMSVAQAHKLKLLESYKETDPLVILGIRNLLMNIRLFTILYLVAMMMVCVYAQESEESGSPPSSTQSAETSTPTSTPQASSPSSASMGSFSTTPGSTPFIVAMALGSLLHFI